MELKCVERLANEHTAQCLHYLRASGRTVCLLVNFQRPKVEWKRWSQFQDILYGIAGYSSGRSGLKPSAAAFAPLRKPSRRRPRRP